MRTLVIIAAVLVHGANAHAADQPALAATIIDGASVYTPTQMFAAYRDQLGRPITSDGAQAIVAQIEAMYMRDGYVRPEFRLDDDLTGSGILRIEVFEAQVTQVVFSGDAGPYAQRLELVAEDLRNRVPLRSADLQAALQGMRELPGLTMIASTRRDETRRNSYALAIETDFRPIEAVVELTNRGTSEIGPTFGFGQIIANNLFGLQERVGLLFSAATDYEEYRGGGLFVDVPIGERGTHVTATAFASKSDPTDVPDRDDRYTRERAVMRVTRPAELAARFRVAWSAGLDFDDLEIMRGDSQLRNERLRVAEIGARLSGRPSGASQYLVAMQLRQGIDGLGSTLEASDLVYDPRRTDFLSIRVQFTQLVRFAGRWSARLDALGQQSAYVLPDAERYKIGGERLGRGFEVTEIAGDQGIGGKAELRRELSGSAAAFGKTSAYAFYDFGAAWKQDAPGRESAVSSGLGLSIDYGRLSGYVEIAKPLTHADVEGDRDAKLFAELSLKL